MSQPRCPECGWYLDVRPAEAITDPFDPSTARIAVLWVARCVNTEDAKAGRPGCKEAGRPIDPRRLLSET